MTTKKTTTRQRKPSPKQVFPKGWDERRVRETIAYYDAQPEADELAEYESALEVEGQSLMLVPSELVPAIRQLIDYRKGA